MKCFLCGAKCITEYIHKYIKQEPVPISKVVAVQKVCTICDWKSYPTKIPESIAVDVQACTSIALEH